MNLAIWLWRAAQHVPGKPALYRGTGSVVTYAGFAARAAAIAMGLRSLYDVKAGDRVALLLSNRPDYLTLLFGIWAAGAVAVPINVRLHAREAALAIADADVTVVFLDAESGAGLASLVECPLIGVEGADFERLCAHPPIDAPVERAGDDLAWLFYTSGTTGRAKGVMLANGNLHAMAYAYLADVDDPGPDGIGVYAAPLSHGAGLYSLVHVLRGNAHVVPASGGFDPDELLALARHHMDMSLFAAPTMVKRLVDRAAATGADGTGFRTIVYGGGPMYLADIERAVQVMGPRFVQIYGQGESPMTITALPRDLVADRAHPRWRERLATVGRAHSCVEVRVVDAAGRPLPANETGEIVVRGAPVMHGYWNNPKATAETLRDGWLWTGDLGALDEDGFLTLKDRSKDVIISGGANIYPREVEEVLLLHPDVAEACVLGRANAEWGEEVVAFVVARAGRSVGPDALDHHCLEHIARFKRPKHYQFVAALPKNAYGKVLKTALRDRLAVEGHEGREQLNG